MPNKLILFCGPSGSGKTTIVKYLLANSTRLTFSVSATTRQKRTTEIDGKDYHFISVDDFKKHISNNDFIEWEEVYTNGYYGTLKADVDAHLKNNKVVLFDVDVEGGLNIKKYFGENLLAVFVQPPSVIELEHRLIARQSESAESLKKRLAKASLELTYANRFDKVLINDNLETALWHAQKMVEDFTGFSLNA
ncbi:MAG: guanylate kinase [Bacteroidia bacterium]|nr:guanylate kinase [Bacteroidia bacterium]HQV01492.1 guanylate kinase [Bacteroidia bacterium]